MKNEKGEDLFNFKTEDSSKPQTFKMLAETRATKISSDVEKEFKSHE